MSACLLSDFSVIQLEGEDSRSFLQGQVTCDVNKIDQVDFLPGCHCNAKGKMWSTFIAIEHAQTILLIMTKESAQASLRELNKYGVFAKVNISDVTEQWHIYGSTESLANTHNIKLTNSHYLSLSSEPVKLTDTIESTLWWKDEIMSGRAHLFDESIEQYVPQMLNLQALDYISFNKGCYMGQEMVARMRYLGKNKRALYLATANVTETLPNGSDVAINLNGHYRNSGKVINSVVVNDTLYVQMVLPKDTELTESVYAGTEHQVHLSLTALPYTLE